MADPLTQELLQRQMAPNDPQAAWSKASSIGAQPLPKLTLGMMPLTPGDIAPGVSSDLDINDMLMTSIPQMLKGMGLSKAKAKILDMLGYGAKTEPMLEKLPYLGELNREFTPVGGEAAYNATRPTQTITDPTEQVYQNILRKGGR